MLRGIGSIQSEVQRAAEDVAMDPAGVSVKSSSKEEVTIDD